MIFRHRLVARGKYAQPIGYVIVDSTGATLADSFYDYQGVSMEDSISVYEESIPFDSAGSYCQTLTITYDRPVGQQVRTSTSCVDVTVEEKPTQILGRVEVSVGEQTISSGWNAGVDEPAVLDVTIHEGESVDVYFDEYMKGVDGTNKKINYEITNSYYLGKKKTGVFNYDISNSDVENNISNSFVDEVKKTMTICETLHFTHLGTTQTAEACARITLDKPTKTVGKPGDASSATRFTAHVDPYLSIKAEQTSLRQEGGINELLRTGTSVTIATNNTSGYTATITSGLDSRDQNAGSLYNSASNSYIPSLLNSTLRKDFPVNSWGFSFDDTEDGNNESTYNRLVPSDSAFPYVFSESNHPDEKIHDVFFAAKADVTKASGTYSADVSLKAVAAVNPLVHETIDDLYYMQDISDAIIDSMVVNTQYKLYDRRDGKGYWVAKLEDGNVWMTQNLDFVLKDGQCLYEGDSDVTRNESSLSYCFQTNGGTSTSVKDSWLDQNTPRLYYDDYYMAGISNSDKGYSYRPASDELLGKEVSFSVESDDTSYSTVLILPNYLVDGKTPTFYNNTTDCANANNVPVEVCEHWFIGTYYTDGIAFDGYQPNTICPGRWTLPRENFSTLVAGKQVEDLLGAPYYMNYSGFYGYRNASIKYDQWLFFPQYIAYMYGNSWGSKNASSYKPYPAVSYGWGLDPFFAMINPQSTFSDYLQDLKSNEGQATAIRCVAKKGF